MTIGLSLTCDETLVCDNLLPCQQGLVLEAVAPSTLHLTPVAFFGGTYPGDGTFPGAGTFPGVGNDVPVTAASPVTLTLDPA
jgi:hypothetical protein